MSLTYPLVFTMMVLVIPLKGGKAAFMDLDKMMREIWRLNALVNGLHEPYSLAESCLKQADELIFSVKSWKDEEEQQFFRKELASVAESLSRTAAELQALNKKLAALTTGEGSGQSGK